LDEWSAAKETPVFILKTILKLGWNRDLQVFECGEISIQMLHGLSIIRSTANGTTRYTETIYTSAEDVRIMAMLGRNRDKKGPNHDEDTQVFTVIHVGQNWALS
jgi:hypothetical protein